MSEMQKGRLAEVGDTIQRGEPIPANVTDLADGDTNADGWSRWVRTAGGGWLWAQESNADVLRSRMVGGASNEALAADPACVWPVRVLAVGPEFAPPREPRVWPKIDGAPDDVRCVQVAGQFWDREAPLSARRWRKRGTTERETWSQLRARGEVREVNDADEEYDRG